MHKIKELWSTTLWFKIVVILFSILIAYSLPTFAVLVGFVIFIYSIVSYIRKFNLKKPTRFNPNYLLLAGLAPMLIGSINPSYQNNINKQNEATSSSIKKSEAEEQSTAASESKAKAKSERKAKASSESKAIAKSESESKAKSESIEKKKESESIAASQSAESQSIADSESTANSISVDESTKASESYQQAQQASISETPVSSSGYHRDYRGRWHRPNGQYASKVEIAQAGLAW